MLLSAGLGSRMTPLSDTCPKPLLHVGGRPQIDYMVDSFERAGIEKFVVNAWYLSEQVQKHFIDKENTVVLVEDERLETGGGVKNALSKCCNILNDVFFVANTDSIIIDAHVSMARMLDMFDDTMDALLLVIPKSKATGYVGGGDFSIHSDSILARNTSGDYVFSGVQIVRRSLFEDTPNGSFSLNVVYNKALEKGRLKGFVHQGDWYHISTPSDVEKMNTLFEHGKV